MSFGILRIFWSNFNPIWNCEVFKFWWKLHWKFLIFLTQDIIVIMPIKLRKKIFEYPAVFRAFYIVCQPKKQQINAILALLRRSVCYICSPAIYSNTYEGGTQKKENTSESELRQIFLFKIFSFISNFLSFPQLLLLFLNIFIDIYYIKISW